MRATLTILCGLMWLVGVAWAADSTRAEDAVQASAPTPVAAAPAAVTPAGTDRKSILAANVVFGKDEASGFWPLYRDYRRDVDGLNDKRVRAINAYAESFRTMTGDDAKGMLEDLLQADESLVKVKRDYLKKFLKVLPQTKVTRVFIIDGKFDADAMHDLMAKVPLAGADSTQ